MSALALLACALALPAADPPGRKLAVLVGVNRFDSRNLPALEYAVNDATEMADVLKGLGYQVTLLTDATPVKPTKVNVEAAFRRVLREAKRADTVVIGLSAHGLQYGPDKQKGAYFCPADAVPKPDRADTLIGVSDLYRELDDSAAGVRILLVDACRNDPTAPPAGKTRSGVAAAITAAVPPTGVGALFSCSVGQESLEHPRLKHGVFFHHVIEGFKGAAAGADGEVTFYTLADYVTRRVGKTAAQLQPGHVQTPNPRADLQGEPPVLATVKAGAAPPSRAMPAQREWTDLLAGGTLSAWQKVGTGGWDLSNGVLSADGKGRGMLATFAEYTDYQLELEFRLPPKGNSGIFLRAWADPKLFASPVAQLFREVQLCDDDGIPGERWKTGSLHGHTLASPPARIEAGRWHTAGVTVRGGSVAVRIDGAGVLSEEINWRRAAGLVGLQVMDTPVSFRNVRVRTLAP